MDETYTIRYTYWDRMGSYTLNAIPGANLGTRIGSMLGRGWVILSITVE